MKRIMLPALVLLMLSACKQETKPAEEARVPAQYTIEQFMNNEAVSPNGFSADGSKLLLSSNRSGIYNLYTVPSTGGDMTALTASDSASVFGISYFPKDDRILFRMDGNGDEIYKMFVLDSTGITRITPAENVRTLFYKWNKDGSGFYFGSNEREPQFNDVYFMDTNSLTYNMVYKNEQGMEIADISEDGKNIILGKPINTNDSDLFLFNTETGKLTQINAVQAAHSPQDFSPNGEWYYYTTDADQEFSYLMRYQIESGVAEKVEQRDWDILGAGFSKQGTYRTLFINADARNVIEVVKTEDGSKVDFPDFGDAEVLSVGFSQDDSMAWLSVGGSHTPTNIYTYNMGAGTLTKITNTLNPEIDPQDLVKAKIVRFPSFDSLEIPAVYYEPLQASATNKVPALVWVHGGPGGQSRTNFSSMIQYMVNHGYAVLAVNNRGSSGYGKTFYRMDDQNHGDKDLKDCIAGKDWLAAQETIDSSSIGILGGSYGGFMTMAALTYAPDEFAVGVNLFGVTNWLRTLKSIPPWWASFKDALYEEMGDPNTADSVRLREISPLFHTDRVTKPLIVLQGSQDPRVLQVESDEIVAGVKANGVPVEYVLFEDEGHGFVKKENQIEAYERILEFLNTHLKEQKSDPDLPPTE